MTAPATVHGNKQSAIAYFEEDSRGDLVDIRFVCFDCNGGQAADENGNPIEALVWPAYDFSPDYDTHCNICNQPIHVNGI